MFDTPIDDYRPGRLVRMGFPYHGLLEFPALQDALSAPLSTVKLTTHGGKTLYPFSGIPYRAAVRTPLIGATRLFMDPRAIMEHEDPDTGEDWSGYLCLSEQGRLAGEQFVSGGPTGAAGIYHDHGTGQNHIWALTNSIVFRVYNQISISRRGTPDADWAWDYIEAANPSGGLEAHHVCDSTPDGARNLFYIYRLPPAGIPGPLVRLDLAGSWPDITLSRTVLMGGDETYSTQTTLDGTQEVDAPGRLLTMVPASCSWSNADSTWQCLVTVIDEPVPPRSNRTFNAPYSGSRRDQQRWLATAHFDGETVVPLWFEHDEEASIEHQADWDSFMEEFPGPGDWPDVGAHGRIEFNLRTERTRVHDWRLKTHTGEILSAARLTMRHIYTRSFLREGRAGGKYGTRGEYDDEDIENNSYSADLFFAGIDVLAKFPEFNAAAASSQVSNPRYPDYYTLSDTSVPLGENRFLSLRCAPFLYARDLVCMRLHCVFQVEIEGQGVTESREIQIFGTAYYKGEIDAGNHIIDGPETVYGAGCPRTKKIARNYPYPVAWI